MLLDLISVLRGKKWQNKQNVNILDNGKGMFKIIWNWGPETENPEKRHLAAPRSSIALATIAEIDKTYSNISKIFEKVQLNKIYYKMAQDLKC